MKSIRLLILLLCAAVFTLPLACQHTYTLSAQPGPTATPTCSDIFQQPNCSSTGITWGDAIIQMDNSYAPSAFVALTANCSQYTTATVTVSYSSGSTVLPYFGTLFVNGTTYSNYSASLPSGSLVPGQSVTITTVAGSSTAFVVMVVPPSPTIASDGSTATWSGSPDQYNVAYVQNSNYTNTYTGGTCWSLSSPLSYPASAYPSSGTYYVYAECINYTYSISGGSGSFFIQNETAETVVK